MDVDTFFSFPLANVLYIMGKDFPKEQVISPKLFGNLAKPMAWLRKLVTYQVKICTK